MVNRTEWLNEKHDVRRFGLSFQTNYYNYLKKIKKDTKVSIDCVWYVLKDSLAKLNSAKYLSAVISRSWVMAYWK